MSCDVWLSCGLLTVFRNFKIGFFAWSTVTCGNMVQQLSFVRRAWDQNSVSLEVFCLCLPCVQMHSSSNLANTMSLR